MQQAGTSLHAKDIAERRMADGFWQPNSNTLGAGSLS
ncbi:MAG: hypothetical protein H7842_01105 [Gammaproteobacteria bacterium SHHR-1]